MPKKFRKLDKKYSKCWKTNLFITKKKGWWLHPVKNKYKSSLQDNDDYSNFQASENQRQSREKKVKWKVQDGSRAGTEENSTH